MASTTPSAPARRVGGEFIGEETRAVGGVVVERGGTFLDLGQGLCDRLAHLIGGQQGQAGLVAAQFTRHGAQVAGALGETQAAPVAESGVGALHGFGDLPGRELAIGADPSPRVGIRGNERHGAIIARLSGNESAEMAGAAQLVRNPAKQKGRSMSGPAENAQNNMTLIKCHSL